MSENEIMSIALGIGRALARRAWWEMSPMQAEEFCLIRAREKGVPDNQVSSLVRDAMEYVIKPTKYELQNTYANR